MFERIKGVFRLDVATFEEIEADENATSQAAIIVAIVALLSAIGAFVGARFAGDALDQLSQLEDFDLPFDAGALQLSPGAAFFNALVGAFVAWLLWSALTYFIGTSLFGGKATLGEMLRVVGYAQAPRLLSVFSFIPCLGGLLAFAGAIWSLATGFIGIRQGLDIDNTKTALTVVVSWLAAVIVQVFVLGPIFRLIM